MTLPIPASPPPYADLSALYAPAPTMDRVGESSQQRIPLMLDVSGGPVSVIAQQRIQVLQLVADMPDAALAETLAYAQIVAMLDKVPAPRRLAPIAATMLPRTQLPVFPVDDE